MPICQQVYQEGKLKYWIHMPIQDSNLQAQAGDSQRPKLPKIKSLKAM